MNAETWQFCVKTLRSLRLAKSSLLRANPAVDTAASAEHPGPGDIPDFGRADSDEFSDLERVQTTLIEWTPKAAWAAQSTLGLANKGGHESSQSRLEDSTRVRRSPSPFMVFPNLSF